MDASTLVSSHAATTGDASEDTIRAYRTDVGTWVLVKGQRRLTLPVCKKNHERAIYLRPANAVLFCKSRKCLIPDMRTSQ